MTKFEPTEKERELLKYLNEEIQLQGLLYDMNLLPEQLTYASPQWSGMKCMIIGYRFAKDNQKGPQ